MLVPPLAAKALITPARADLMLESPLDRRQHRLPTAPAAALIALHLGLDLDEMGIRVLEAVHADRD
jgi:hypothetical protein